MRLKDSRTLSAYEKACIRLDYAKAAQRHSHDEACALIAKAYRCSDATVRLLVFQGAQQEIAGNV